MKVILIQDVKGTGKKDAIVEVSDGYARNFLFPRKLAMEANDHNLNSIHTAKSAQAHRKSVEKDEAMAQAKHMETLVTKVSVKAGENGRLFGSVTAQEIADCLKAQHGIEIDKRKITMEPIRQLGETSVEVKLYPEVSATIKLEVLAQ